MSAPSVYAKAIRQAWRDRVELLLPLPTIYENLPPATELPSASPWCSHAILWAEHLRADFGSAAEAGYRFGGRVSINYFHPIQTAMTLAWGTVDAVDTTFRGLRLSPPGVAFLTPIPLSSGATPDSRWWQIHVELPFQIALVAPLPA